MSARPVDLSVVIVNYNTRQLTLECLASLDQGAAGLCLEPILIDNASTDGSVEAIRAAFPAVTIIANPDNRYFSEACNQGLAAAHGRYALLLNPDTVVQSGTLAQLIAYMDANPQVGAATTTMRFPDGSLQRNGSRAVTFGYLAVHYTLLGKLFPAWRRAINADLWYSGWDRTTPRQIDVLPGSCLIAARETWAAVGGLDAHLPMYFSDDYVSRVVRTRGKQTMYVVSNGIIHYENASTRTVSTRAARLYYHDLLVYTHLVFGRAAQISLAALLLPNRLKLMLSR